MADLLDQKKFEPLRGTVRARIDYSGIKPLEDDPNVERWTLKWTVTDEDSIYQGQDIWERFFFYPNLSEDELEIMSIKDKSRMVKNYTRRTRRLLGLGVKEDDFDSVDFTSFKGIVADITVNTDNRGFIRVQNATPIDEETEASNEEATPNIDI